MNQEVEQFLKQARENGLSNDQILQLLTDQGWPEAQARAAVFGLHVPSPQNGTPQAPEPPAQITRPTHESSHHGSKRRSIGALEAALQHVLLWVFTGASTIMIGIVSYALFMSGASPSSATLLAFLVVELVTFIPFAVLFVYYLRSFRQYPDLTTGKVWSILTIVFHAIGLMSAIIGLILVLVLVRDDASKPSIIYSSAMIAVNSAVLAAYVTANFVRPQLTWRKYALNAFPIALFLIIAVFGLVALTRVGPLKADDATRQQLVDVVNDVKAYVKENDRLPNSLDDIDTDADGITYNKNSKSTYKYDLCASFKVDTSESDYYGDDYITDSYVTADYFKGVDSGEQCFEIEAYDLYQDTEYSDEYDYTDDWQAL